MFAARAKKRSGSSARNEGVSVWFRGLSVRNIALGTNRSSSGQVNAVLLGVCNNLNRVPKARPLTGRYSNVRSLPAAQCIPSQLSKCMLAGRSPFLHAALSRVHS